MKLRIRGNSVRLRLTRAEVAAAGAGGEVAECAAIGPGPGLEYRLRADASAGQVSARFADGCLRVVLPETVAAQWAATEQVSIEAEQPGPDGAVLKILVEKDFACLAERPGEDDSDAFPHPDSPGC